MASYSSLAEVKPELRPSGITISPTGKDAKAPMAPLLEHTVKRVIEANPEVKENVKLTEEKYQGHDKQYVAYFKFGCDGLTGLTKFRQELDEDDVNSKKDGKVMASHLILLQIVCLIGSLGLELIQWTNPLLNAADACRPLRHSDPDLKKQINKLIPLIILGWPQD